MGFLGQKLRLRSCLPLSSAYGCRQIRLLLPSDAAARSGECAEQARFEATLFRLTPFAGRGNRGFAFINFMAWEAAGLRDTSFHEP